MDKTPADVLEEAADLLLVKGRCREVWRTPDGEHCLIGAIADVLGEMHADGTVPTGLGDTPAVLAVLNERRFEHIGDAFDWNDDPNTSDDDVRDLLLLTAKNLRNGEA